MKKRPRRPDWEGGLEWSRREGPPGLPATTQDQVLLLGSKTLSPQRKPSSYGIDRQATIRLTPKVVKPSEEELPLFLMEMGEEGQRHLLPVRSTSSAAQVKQMIESKTAVVPEKRIVVCNGKKLEDGKTMAEYGIKRGAVLLMTKSCVGE